MVTDNKRISIKKQMTKPDGYLTQIISLELSMEIQEFLKHLLLPVSEISSTSINLLVITNTSTWIKGENCSITQMYITSNNNLVILYTPLELIPPIKMGQSNKLNITF